MARNEENAADENKELLHCESLGQVRICLRDDSLLQVLHGEAEEEELELIHLCNIGPWNADPFPLDLRVAVRSQKVGCIHVPVETGPAGPAFSSTGSLSSLTVNP